MPIVAASNGVKPAIRALGVIQLNVPVTPSEIDAHVKTGEYSSKYVSKLKALGFVFQTTKNGREVVHYTLVGEPENAAEIRATQPKAKKPKVVKEPKVKVLKEKKTKQKATVAPVEVTSEERKESAKAFVAKRAAGRLDTTPKKVVQKAAASKRKSKELDETVKTFGSDGSVAGSGAIDAGWDSVEGMDVSKLL